MEKPNPLRVEDFLLFITSQKSILTLEVEHEPTEKIFTINLDSDFIGQVSNGLFESVDEMVQGLKDGTNGNFENSKLTLNSQGKLTYTVIFTAGMIKKESSFTLNLTEKELKPTEIFSRKLNFVKGELEKWKIAQETKEEAIQELQVRNEERFDRLENMMIRMEKRMAQFNRLENLMGEMEQKMAQRLDGFEKLYANRQAPIIIKPDVSFNNYSRNHRTFKLSDNNKTATRVCSGGECLEVLPQIPSSGQYSYLLRINSGSHSSISFGITNKKGNFSWNWDHSQEYYQYSCYDGKINGRVSQQPTGDGPFGGQNRIIKMVIDMDQGTLTFFVDDKQVNYCKLLKEDRFFVNVALGQNGDSVTLL